MNTAAKTVEGLITYLAHKLSGPAHVVVASYVRMAVINGIEFGTVALALWTLAVFGLIWRARYVKEVKEAGDRWTDDDVIRVVMWWVMIAGCGTLGVLFGSMALNHLADPTYVALQQFINQLP
ncbi:MAG: hypothetical protein ACLGPL_06585 [Acidobacteriota bacterium]